MLQSMGSQRARRDRATEQQASSLNTPHSGARTGVYSCLRIAETSTSKEWTEVRLINAWCQEIIISEVIFFYLYQWREHKHLLKGAKQVAQIMLSTISYIWLFLSLLKKKQNQDFVPSTYKHQKLSRSAHLSWCLRAKRLLFCTWEEAEGNSVELDREDELCPNQRIAVPANDLHPRTSGSSKQVSRWIFVFTLEVYISGLLKGNGTVEMKPD